MENNTTGTEEFFKDYSNLYQFEEGDSEYLVDKEDFSKALIEFAKLHVISALQKASEKATMNLTYPDDYADSNETGLTYADAHEISRGGEYGSVEIDHDSILNAYDLSSIK